MSATLFFIFKAALSGLLIAAISAIAKYSPKWAALLTALPLMTYLSLIWIYAENRDLALLETYLRDVLLWIFPGLFFFLALIALFHWRVPFLLSLLVGTAILAGATYLFGRLGIIR